MAITSSSATIQFNVGSFDYQTSLDIPPSGYEDKITPRFNDFVTDELDSPIVFVMYKQEFQGNLVYQHPQFDADFSQLAVITNPDVRLDEGSASDDVTLNKLLDIVKDSSGKIVDGRYVITMRYVYILNQVLTPITVTYTIDFKAPDADPMPTSWYDTQVPTLTIEDKADYVFSGVSPSLETEFKLFPPMSGTPQVTTGVSQSVTYGSFWAGQNELKYTIFLTYDLITHEVLVALQAYDVVSVVNTDKKSVYNCLKSLYDQWKGCPCGTKKYEIIEAKIKEATVLAQLIVSGSGCGLDTLSKVVERFNQVTGCECAKPTLKPRFITASLIAEKSEVQNITATTATTVINLSVGNKVYVTLNADTEIVVTNMAEKEKYTFVFVSPDGFKATFSETFVWNGGFELEANPFENPFGVAAYYFEESDGELISMLSLGLPEPLSDGAKNTLREEDGELFWEPVGSGDFLSAGDDVSLLTNDAGYITLGDIPPVPAVFQRASFQDVSTNFSFNIVQTNANVIELSTSSSILWISMFSRTNIQLGRPYIFIVRNKGASNLPVTFAGGDFTDSSGSLVSSSIPAGRTRSFTFVGSQPDGFANKTMVSVAKDENYIKQGDNISLLANNANYLTLGSNISLLNNNLGFISEPFGYSDIGSISGSVSVNFEDDGEYQKFDVTDNLLLSTTGTLSEGKKYGLILKNTSATLSRSVQFTSPVFINTPSLVIPAGVSQFIFVEFMGISFGGNVALIPTGQNIRPNIAALSSSPEEVTVAQTNINGTEASIREFWVTGNVPVFNFTLISAVALTEYVFIIKNDSVVSKDVSFNLLTGPITPDTMVEVFDGLGSEPSYTVDPDTYIAVTIRITTDRTKGVVTSVTPNTL